MTDFTAFESDSHDYSVLGIQNLLKNALILCQQVKDQTLGYLRTCIFGSIVQTLYGIDYTVRFVGYVDVKCIKNANISILFIYFSRGLNIFVKVVRSAYWKNRMELIKHTRSEMVSIVISIIRDYIWIHG